MAGPATKEALARAESIKKTQSFAPSIEEPNALPDSNVIKKTIEVEGSMVRVIDKDGVVKEVRTKATLIQDEGAGTSRFIAGTPDRLGLSQVRRISRNLLYPQARATLASETKRIKQRSKRREKS